MTESNSGKPIGNPLADDLKHSVIVPNKLTSRFIEESSVRSFELWFSFGVGTSNVATGFWTAFATNSDNTKDKLLLIISLCFTLLALAFFIVGLRNRHKGRENSQEIDLYLTAVKPQEK